MNRFAVDSIIGVRRVSTGTHQSRREHVTAGDGDDTLDLFSRNRASTGSFPGGPISPSAGAHGHNERISVGAARIGRGGMEDMLDSEMGKHDYDWLLTPPETPVVSSSFSKESSKESVKESSKESPLSSTPRGRATARSASTTRASRLSTTQTETSHSTRPVRSSSVTRPSVASSVTRTSISSSGSRPSISSSGSRPSMSNNYSANSFTNNNRTSVLNTSSTSVTSSRPSTPGSRSTSGRASTTSSIAKPSMTSTTTRPSVTSTTSRPSSSSSSRPTASRLPTPTRTRQPPTVSGDRTTRPSQNSRPSTPTSRPQTPSNPIPNLNTRPSSRPSTPTRRSTTAASSGASARFPAVGQRAPATNSRNQAAPASRPSSPGPRPRAPVNQSAPASRPSSRPSSPGPRPRAPVSQSGPASRPSSPGPRPRAPVRPIDLPDFPNEAPPNLRTKLPERPASAGRTRPGMALTVRASSNSEAGMATVPAASVSSNRRNYLPVMSRSRFPENPPKVSTKVLNNNGYEAAPEIQKAAGSDSLRRPLKTSSASESTGFGRTISKKSLDMALRHMDIKGMGGLRASSLFPQSIRSTTKGRPARKSDPVVPLASDDYTTDNGSCNGTFSPSYSLAASEIGDFSVTKSPDRDSIATRESDLDIHGSSHYENFMLKEEDSKNMSWLHSAEDKSDQSPVFDHGFEPPPEPFGML